ncbi:MAG: heme-binding protein [Candidatus Cybelea sp.]
MNRIRILSLIVAATIALPVSARAQVSERPYVLPLTLAVAAAEEAVHTCAARGWDVTATVVDVSGVPKVVLRGDYSTIHTPVTAFRKAYTIVTMGPIFKLDNTAQFVEQVEHSRNAPVLATLPNVIALAGGVAIKVGNEIVAGLGVGGSPGDTNDEICAQAGVDAIQNRLPH